MGAWAPALLAVVCVACAGTGCGLYAGRRWGYRLTVILLLVHLAADIVNTVLGIEPRAAVGIPIVALVLWYLSSRSVRTYFAPAVSRTG
jgi:hypothetical protein